MLLALALAHAEPYALLDAGMTFELPGGWEMTEWSNWDFKGRTLDRSIALDAWYTPFQLPVTKENASEWAALYREKLEDMKAVGVTRDTVEVREASGRTTAFTTMRFTLEKGGPKGAMFVASFATEGKIMHVATLAVGPNVPRAQSGLDAVLARLTVQRQPADTLALGGEVKTELGFSATLPDGWRKPLAIEDEESLKLIGGLGIGPKDPTTCFRAIHPMPNGEAALMVFCSEPWKMGILDEASFLDEELLLKQRFFGKAADKIPAADRLTRTDRLGILLAPEINGKDLRIAALPYDRGTVVAWGVGEPGTGELLTSSLRSTSMSLAFDGPDGGASVHEAGEWVVHTLTYQPWHPAILASVALFLGVLAGVGYVVFRKPAHPPMHH